MFILRRIKNDKWLSLSVFIITFITATLIFPLIELMGTSILVIVDNTMGLRNVTAPIAIFSSVLGVIIVVAISVFMITVSLSIKSRFNRFKTLRLIGATYRQISRPLLYELIIMGIVASIVAALLSPVLSNAVVDFLRNSNAIEPSFKVIHKFYFPMLGFVILLLILYIVFKFTVLPIKNISISTSTSLLKKKRKVKFAFKMFFGLAFLGGAIVLVVLKPINQGGMGVGMAMNSILCFVLAFSMLGEYLIYMVAWIILRFMSGFRVVNLSMKSILINSSRLVSPITLAVVASTFAAYSIDVPSYGADVRENMLRDMYGTSILYAGDTDGIKLSSPEMQNISNDPNINLMSTSMSGMIYRITDKSDPKGSKDYVEWYGVAGQKVLFETRDPHGKPNALLDGTVANPVYVSRSMKKSVGDTMDMIVEGKTVKFNVVATFNRRIKFTGLPDVFFSSKNLQALGIKMEVDMISSKNKSSPKPVGFSEITIDQISAQESNVIKSIASIITLVILIYSLIAVANVLATFYLRQVKEMKLLRNIGLTSFQIFRKALYETVILALISMMVSIFVIFVVNVGYTAGNYLPIELTTSWGYFITIMISIWVSFIGVSVPIISIMKRKKVKEA